MKTEHERRLARIESHLAHLERHLEQLNEVVIEQGRVLRRLQSLQQRLSQTIETIELDRIKSTSARPPHSR
jgi:uncharacterized coiled-coil protein SlyX